MKSKITKYLNGKASGDELKNILQWIEKDDNQKAFRNIKDEWKNTVNSQSLNPETLNELDKFNSKIHKQNAGKIRKLKFRQNIYKYAAVMLLLISIGSFWFSPFGNMKAPLMQNSIIAENGQISKAILPDNSVIWLNSGSSINYSSDFGVNNRNIELKGQAYFEVSKNKELPFVVSSDEIKVRVLGTKFSVEAYRESNNIEVILEEGSVELLNSKSDQAFAQLKPNEKLEFDKQINRFNIETVEAKRYTAWREGILNIYDQSLEEAINKIAKRYNQKIIVDEGIKDYKITISIRDEDFNTVLDLIEAFAPVSVKHNKDIIYMKHQ